MAIYVIYDPTNSNVIRCWIECMPEMMSYQPIETYEVIAELTGAPPILGRIQKIYNPTTGEITDGEDIGPPPE